MRKKIIAGNWKMNKIFSESIELTKEILKLKILSGNVSVIITPPFPFIPKLSKLLKQSRKPIALAAQNCHWEEEGAFTGEISAAMLKSVGVEYVIIGHSERRIYFNEGNEILTKKVKQALKQNLFPIFCCGESLAERKSGKYLDVIKEQLESTIFNCDEEQIKKIIIAYEPVWAIGTGTNATSDQAQEVHAFIRKAVSSKYGNVVANELSILYGGSCNEKNADELFNCKDVDGGLIGGASLSADSFGKIIEKLQK